jgi:putative PIN family toxin of toxin-antitoxin system
MAVVPRIVVDSNILISAIAFGGKPEEVVGLADRGEIRLFLSQFILDEVRRVLLRPKFSVAPSDVEEFLDFLRYKRVRRRTPALRVSRDPKDNPILECAVAAKADFLVTGDRDLLDLERHEKIAIVTPADFLRQRAEEEPEAALAAPRQRTTRRPRSK